MGTLTIQKTLVQAITTRDQMEDLQAEVIARVVRGIQDQLRAETVRRVKTEIRDVTALLARMEHLDQLVPRVLKAHLVLKVQADLATPVREVITAITGTAVKGIMAASTTAITATGTVMVEDMATDPEDKARINLRGITMGMVDMAADLMTGVPILASMEVPTTVMMDMTAELTLDTKEKEVKEVTGPETETAPTTMVVDTKGITTVIMATGKANINSPWKL